MYSILFKPIVSKVSETGQMCLETETSETLITIRPQKAERSGDGETEVKNELKQHIPVLDW